MTLAQAECAHFQHFQIQQILKVENDKADRLGKTVSWQEAAPIQESAILRTVKVLAMGIKLLEVGPGVSEWA